MSNNEEHATNAYCGTRISTSGLVAIGVFDLVDNSTDIKNGLYLETPNNGATVFAVSAVNGVLTRLDVTQTIKDFGWMRVTY